MALAIKLKLLYGMLLANICCIDAQKGYGSVWQMNNPSTVPGHASSVADYLGHVKSSSLQPDSSTYGSSLMGDVLGHSHPAVAKPIPNSFWASYLLGSGGYKPSTVKPSTSCYDSSGCGSVQTSSVFPQYVGSQIRHGGGQSAVQQATFAQSRSGSAHDTDVWSSSVQKPVSGLTQTGYGSTLGLESQVVTDSIGYGTAVELSTQGDVGSVQPTGTQTKFGSSQSTGHQAGSTSLQTHLPLQGRSTSVQDGVQSKYSSVQNVFSGSAPRVKYNPVASSTGYYGSSLGIGSQGSQTTSQASGSQSVSDLISTYSDGLRSGQMSYDFLKGSSGPSLTESSCDSGPRAQIGSSVTLGRSGPNPSRFGSSATYGPASSTDTMLHATSPSGYGIGSRASCNSNQPTGIELASGTNLGSSLRVGFQNRYGLTRAGQSSDIKGSPSYGFQGGLDVAHVTGSQSSSSSLLNPFAFSQSTGSGSLQDVDVQSGYGYIQNVASSQGQDGYGFSLQMPPKSASNSGFYATVLESGSQGHGSTQSSSSNFGSTQSAGSQASYSSVQGSSGSLSRDCGLTPDMGSHLNLGFTQVNCDSGLRSHIGCSSRPVQSTGIQSGYSSTGGSVSTEPALETAQAIPHASYGPGFQSSYGSVHPAGIQLATGSNVGASYGSQGIHGSTQTGHSSGKYSLTHHSARSGMGSQLVSGSVGPYGSIIGFGSPSCGSSQVSGLQSVSGPTQRVSYPSSGCSGLSSSETSYTSVPYGGIYDSVQDMVFGPAQVGHGSVSIGIPTSTQGVGSQGSFHLNPYSFGQGTSSSAQGANNYSAAKIRSQQRSDSAQVNPGYPGSYSSPTALGSASQNGWMARKFLPHLLSGN